MLHATSLAGSQDQSGGGAGISPAGRWPKATTRREFLTKGVSALALGTVAAGSAALAVRVREAGALTKTFTHHPSAVFPNPERGWFLPVPGHWYRNETRPHNDPDYPLTDYSLADARAKGMTLVRKYYVIRRWIDSPIPQDYFDEHLLHDFDLCRRNGFKIIPRFAYVWNNVDYPDNDATTGWILRHIDQVMPHLNANLDVLPHLEAGFVGLFGEWHNSRSGNVDPGARINTNSRRIVRALLDGLPKSRTILMRYPRQLMDLYPEPLPASEAYSGTDRSRTGMHDDSLRWNKHHRWGYSTDPVIQEEERVYQEQMTKYVPMSGEPSGDDGSGYVFQNPMPELERMHWRMMNSNWYEAKRDGVYDYWRRNGYLDELNRRLGYRFALTYFTYSPGIRPNETFRFSFGVGNHGFAAPHLKRPVELVVRHDSTGKEYSLPVDTGPRYWQPSAVYSSADPGRPYTNDAAGRLPSGALRGTYGVFLSLPDSWTTLRSDHRYSIRLANNETAWDSAVGYNDLNISFSVKGSPAKPDYSVPEFKPR